ncbi:SDR family NAD(P)-dependent oxidoreductase [Novosphingobium lentum]|uniref:SDR family NAD(P)-dependent oxidoreductase n=1 Tax=Novosphingobium lentum TaxID=145287 RepID=UPI00146FFCFF|nr:SDR family oxidoreductase [Novosphingobium lentum]
MAEAAHVESADRLQDRVAIVTGGSSGIGLAIAMRLVAAGAAVMIAGRDATTGAAARQALTRSGGAAEFFAADVSSEAAVTELVVQTAARFGAPTLLVNNAGPSGDAFGLGAVHELPASAFADAMNIGAMGALYCCQAVLPHMMAQGGGAIVNISAIAAARAIPLMGAYAMCKAALEALGRQVANDYARHGVRCNNLVVGTVRPGPGDVSTLPAGFDHASLDRAVAATTMAGRVGSYAEAAEAALFLLSDRSRFITGANLPVDGGAIGKLAYPDYSDAMAGVGGSGEPSPNPQTEGQA